MKTEIRKDESKPQEPKYPLLKVWELDDSFVVMFTGPSIGVVVSSSDINNPIGVYKRNWSESGFKVFEHELVLSN